MATAKYPARQAEPGTRITHHDRLDGEIELVADKDGVLRPRTAAQHLLAERQGIPLAKGAVALDPAEAQQRLAAERSAAVEAGEPAITTTPDADTAAATPQEG